MKFFITTLIHISFITSLYAEAAFSQSREHPSRINGQVAFVTGATQGIGLAITIALLKKGAKVVMASRNSSQGLEVERQLADAYGQENVMFTGCDVTDVESVEKAIKKTVDRFGRLDIVGNNAGIVHETNYEQCIGVNLLGVIQVSNVAMEWMRKDRAGFGGIIINVASGGGLDPVPFFPVYAASKLGVVGFTRSWGSDIQYARHGVRMNCICPGITDTPLIRTLNLVTMKEKGYLHPEVFAKLISTLPKLSPAAVADGFVQLVEDESKNGAALILDPETQPFYASFNINF